MGGDSNLNYEPMEHYEVDDRQVRFLQTIDTKHIKIKDFALILADADEAIISARASATGELVEKSVLDIGVIRYPNPEKPYIKVLSSWLARSSET